MRKYYYTENGKELGPFTLEELKDKNIDRNTLVWFEGLSKWILAKDVLMLKGHFLKRPPPLPNKYVLFDETSIQPRKKDIENEKYDLEYKREFDAVVIGIFLLVMHAINYSSGFALAFYEPDEVGLALFYFAIVTFYRLTIVVWVLNIANRLNRSKIWAIFAFFMPPFCLIIIGFLRKLREDSIDQ